MLKLSPTSLRAANAYVVQYHRHHKATRGMKFALACEKDGELVGVVIVGRPVNRVLDDGTTLEVNRLCTDGTSNACSFLYGAARRAAKALGYSKLVTYTLPEEGGASLRAAGFKLVAATQGGSWSIPKRPREDKHPLDPKWRWEIEL